MGIFELLTRNGWSLHVGDPYPMGWIIFSGYMITSVLCLFAGLSVKKLDYDGEKKKDTIIWFGLSVIMFLLGLNKQLDLQVLFFDIGSIVSYSQGWFEFRREAQKLFIAGLGLAVIILLVTISVIFRRQLMKNKLIPIGTLLVVSYVLIRASTFSHIEFIPAGMRTISHIHMRYVLELTGIICIGYGAVKRMYRNKRELKNSKLKIEN